MKAAKSHIPESQGSGGKPTRRAKPAPAKSPAPRRAK
jgi:hypothetical protein